MRLFNSAAAFSLKVTAHRRAGKSGSGRPTSASACRQSVTRLCVLPVPAPAWSTALRGCRYRSRSSATAHLGAVLLGIGGKRDEPAGRLEVAVVAGDRIDGEQAAALLLHRLPHLVGEIQRRARLPADPRPPAPVTLPQIVAVH